MRRRIQAPRRVRLALIVAAASAVACRTTSNETAAGGHLATVTRSTPVRTWSVDDGRGVRGYVLRFDSAEEPPRVFFLVRNVEHQDLGLVDALGRAWRYRPHVREPEWMLTGTVLQGARAILGAGPEAELRELSSDASR